MTSSNSVVPIGNWERTADALRAWALDEGLKAQVMTSPPLAAAAQRAARRYTAGNDVDSALGAVRAGLRRGHLGSVEYVGESVRDTRLARAATDVIIDLARRIADASLPSTISLDLSHIGSVVDRQLCVKNAERIAAVCADGETRMMISAEGSDRTDLVLDIYDQLASDFGETIGITLQARLRRSEEDVHRVLQRPGIVRLVKGAFLEDDAVADRRGSTALARRYLALTDTVLGADHALAVATHDPDLIDAIVGRHDGSTGSAPLEFEMLLGLGTELLDRLHAQGRTTREYVIFGGEWWLYVLNRIAEDPQRLVTAVADLRQG